MGKITFNKNQNICTKCRIDSGYTARDDGFHTSVMHECDSCGCVASILSSRHWVIKFDEELKEFNQNRSKYQHIKPDLENQRWSKYGCSKGKHYFASLLDAAKYKDS